MIIIREERPDDLWAREQLLDMTMGPIRFRRSSERLREGRLPARGLALVGECDGQIVATLRLWDVRAKALDGALMLGPLAVAAAYRNDGFGAAMMREGIARAGACGHSAVVLVGDAPYYDRFGFTAAAAARLAMPGPFERHRLLGLELTPGALSGAHGLLKAAGTPAIEPAVAATATSAQPLALANLG